MTDQTTLATIADAIITTTTDYRTRMHLTDQHPIVATVPPTLTPADRDWIARRITSHNIQLETVRPRPSDATRPRGTVQFLIYQAGTFKIEPTGPLPLGAEDVSRDAPGAL